MREITVTLQQLDPATRQALVVTGAAAGGASACLTAWERQGEIWRPLAEPMAAAIGRNGFAAPEEKREGDGRTPSGVYALGLAFGYEAAVATAMPYRQATADDYWVDDPSAPQYNRWVCGRPAAKSCERMLRSDHQYRCGLVVEYNTEPVIAGKGSAIFLHVWQAPGAGTAGCVALAEDHLRRLLAWLEPAKRPVIILAPSASISGC